MLKTTIKLSKMLFFHKVKKNVQTNKKKKKKKKKPAQSDSYRVLNLKSVKITNIKSTPIWISYHF